MNYTLSKRTTKVEWMVCCGLALVAIFFIIAGIYGVLYGTTPKDKIIRVTGIAQLSEISTVAGRQGTSTDFLHFAIGTYPVSFANKQTGYNQLFTAIENRKEITIGVSTQQETIIPRRGWVPLYELSIGDDVILTYEDTIRDSYRNSYAPFYIAAALLMVCGWNLHRCYTNRNL